MKNISSREVKKSAKVFSLFNDFLPLKNMNSNSTHYNSLLTSVRINSKVIQLNRLSNILLWKFSSNVDTYFKEIFSINLNFF